MYKRSLLLVMSFFIAASAWAQTTVRITNADLVAGQDYNWTKNNIYILDDMVFVKPGSKLFIQEGTVIKGAIGDGNDATGLVVTVGAQIFAEGTAEEPIIFTSEADDLNGSLTELDRGLWGGLVVLGDAPTNNATEDGTKLIEGVNEIANPEAYARYGGDDVDDNSGVIRYVSIRHTGINVGDVAGNEIQGLTMGGVGSGTTVKYVESFASNDDGFEFFGGTVNTKYLVSAFNTDDAFDWDEGFQGKHQYWFAIQSPGNANDGYGRAAEQDGATGDENTTPFARPVIANATYLGAGQDATPNAGDGSQLLLFRDNTGGEYYNSIFSDHAGLAVTIEASGKVAGFDAKTRLAEGDLILQNNLWYGFGAGNTIAEFAGGADQAHTRDYLSDAANANRVTDPLLKGISRTADSKGLDPRPQSGSPALDASKVKELSDDFFDRTPYTGAFNASENWIAGWTALEAHGYVSDEVVGKIGTTVYVTDADLVAGEDYNWSKENTYVLSEMVFVKPGSRLFIEEGTVIKGALGDGGDATGLVVTVGAQIFAEGTAEEPIIFTSEIDDLNGSLTELDRGLWGGLVVLGDAPTNNATEDGTKLIEGVNEIANPEAYARYGGDDVDDNSGVIRYVSIRHTGINVGDVAGNEIQGLTMGGVGSGTTVKYVESFASNDDGFEFFGGTVNTKYLVSAFNTDDAFDWDEGFQGKHQYWFAIQSPGNANDGYGRAAEQDGATGDENTTPFARPIISNATYLGAGQDATPNAGDGSQLLLFRDNTGGEYYNSIFSDHAGLAVTIEASGKVAGFDAKTRLAEGDLILQNNLWYGFGAGNTIAEFAGGADQAHTRDYLSDAANANRVADPMLRGISRTAGSNGLDPRPSSSSPALDASAVKTVEDDFFDRTFYSGAFNATENWIAGWTALAAHGYVSEENVDKIGTTVYLTDADFVAGEDFNMTSNNTYVLNEMVFVKPGSRLFIEEGTVIKGALGDGGDATGLVVTVGAQIFAEGTAEEPIIFTSEIDDLNGSLTELDRGLWGGLVVLGDAPTNNATEDGTKLIEGVNEIANPEAYARYGGDDVDDNSGVIRYVSIRHTGINVGDVAGNEIQGLTMGGVGSGTTVEYVESFASNDDGFEFFGGTVNTKYLVSAFNTDDAFDWDEGFQGSHQFWFAIQSPGNANDGYGRAAEQDGATGDENTTPFARPVIANATYLGAGQDATPNAGDGSQLLLFRDNTGGEYYNSIFSDHAGLAVTIEASGKVAGFDAKTRLAEGDLILQNNLWYGFGAGNTIAEFAGGADQAHTRDYLSDAANANRVADPMLRGISRTAGSNGLDPRPSEGSPALDPIAVQEVENPFIRRTSYAGAFNATDNWIAGWTALEAHGYVNNEAVESSTIFVEDADLPAGQSFTWTKNNTYVLDGMIFVKPGSKLFIQEGTVVKGALGDGDNASGLVVTEGAQIFAEGTAEEPIIFTSEADDLNGSLTELDRGLWGGLVVLGDAPTNNATEDGTKLIEGVNEIANPEAYARYGGDDVDDNSGVIRYVSIRHTGINVGDVAGNEIQGLTMGGVGSGTTVEYVESFASNDDGFEFFGGTVNTKYLVSAFNTDDAFDWDEGFQGSHQFWFAIQSPGNANDGYGRAAEQDGATGDENTTPFARPIIANATYLGAGQDATPNAGDGSQLLLFRDNTGGEYYNSIFSDHAGLAVTIEASGKVAGFDAKTRLAEGDLILQNNLWYGFGAGNTIAEFAGGEDQAHTRDYLSDAANANRVADPMLEGISRTAGSNGLDPRPKSGSPALDASAVKTVDNEFMMSTDYVGAFADNYLWIQSWTALEAHGYVSAVSVSNEDETIISEDLPTVVQLHQNYPNPFNPSTQISFTLPEAQQVSLVVYDMLGREVAVLARQQMMPAGSTTFNFDASGLSSGMYIYRLVSNSSVITKKMTLIK